MTVRWEPPLPLVEIPTDCAREEPRLCDSQKHTSDHEAGEVPDNASEGHDDAPADDQDTEICRRPLESFQDDVGRDLEKDVGDEEDGHTIGRSVSELA